jgi:hypothetical protein
MSGNLGFEILRRFNIIFDASRGRVILETNAAFGQPFRPTSSSPLFGWSWPDAILELEGALLKSMPPDFATYRVLAVDENTAASMAGLKPEDMLISVDDTPVSELTVEDLIRLHRQDGRVCRLQIQRHRERLELRLESKPPI